MEEQLFFSVFDEYEEPKQAEKDALIDKLINGDFSLSYSSLAAFSVSPRAFIAYKLKERKTTKSMILGEAVHCKVLEPDMFGERYVIAPDVDGTTVAGKNAWAELYMKLTGDELPTNKQGNYVIPKQELLIEQVKELTKKVDSETGKVLFDGITILPATVNKEADFRARMLVTNGATRHVINMITGTELVIRYEFAGIKFTGRIDGKGAGMICDIKNMPDATLRAAKYQIMARKMHWQAFGYNRAYEEDCRCYILAVDGNGETSAHLFDNKHLERAEVEISEYCRLFLDLVADSVFDRTVWDASQDFWLRNEYNQFGINQL